MPLFGTKKKAAPTTRDSIAKLRETLDMLEKREQFLQKKMDKETAEAKRFLSLNKKREAMECLKRKKFQEGQMSKLSGARMTIEQQVMTLEGASVSLEALTAMQMGAASMKTIHKNMNLDRVDDTMDEIREQMDVANEIADAISQPLGGETIDEDDLLAELDELGQEALDEQLLPAPTPISAALPNAPTKAPTPTKKKIVDEEAELAALEASMS
eukprot:TRINITY_DN3045_c0_g1_i1.p1 TRINITY_DN3045_c0_g1~~TRINITY_DN3045_c0_g1_i1.p1  ORF type:complete len:214 (+),score=71.48 TRINITY_DN3045_c0_g1_i1:80-721(+)